MTQDEWDRIERQIVRAWTSGDVSRAIKDIQGVLDTGNNEQRGRALVYLGSIHEESGNWHSAKAEFSRAVKLLHPGSYAKYTAELSVGHACEKAGENANAVEWYRAALHSCVQAEERFSGASAVKALLSLSPVLLTSDRELARQVTEQSWRVLDIPHNPNLDDLAGSIQTLMDWASRPRR